MSKTVTVGEVVDMLLDGSEFAAVDTLVTVLALMRSAIQREIATDEGVAASLDEWRRQHGEETPDKVRDWVESCGALSAADVPVDYLMKVMAAS